MKILIVSDTLLDGGAELFALRLTRGLKRAGWDVELLSLNKAHEKHEVTRFFSDITIHRLQLPFQKLLEKADELLFKLRIDFSAKRLAQGYLIRRRFLKRYDIVHTHALQVDYLFSKLKSKNNNFRQVVTVHGDYSAQFYEFKKNRSSIWLQMDRKLETLKQWVDQWVVLSDEQVNFFDQELRVDLAHLKKIYNGYEPVIEVPSSRAHYIAKSNQFTIGMVARGVEQKGWRILIDAFLKMPSDCRLVLVGEGAYLDKLKNEFAGRSNILFYGFHPNPVEIIADFDVFVLPTLFPHESLPTVVTEALCCGKAIIASKVGEIEKMITDDTTGNRAGFLVSVVNQKKYVNELYDSLHYLYTHREELDSLGKIAKAAFGKFEMSRCIDSYSVLYRDLID